MNNFKSSLKINSVFITLVFFGCETQNIVYNPSKSEIVLNQSTIIVNPFYVAPLTAIIRVGNDNLIPVDVEKITVKVLGEKDKGVDINGTMYPKSESFKRQFFDISKEKKYANTIISQSDSVEIPVLGLYSNYSNRVEFSIETSSNIFTGQATIQTNLLPDESLSINVDVAKKEDMEPGEVTWITFDQYNYDLMFDYTGEVRWIIDVRGNSDLRILKNRNLLIKPWRHASHLGEYTLLGEEVYVWNIFKNYKNHHDIFEMPSGNFLIPVDRLTLRNEGYKTWEDCIIEINRLTSEIVNSWDLFELMDIKNLPSVWNGAAPGDWYHMNSLWYDELKDEIIVSGKYGGVLKLSRNGENGSNVNKNKDIIWFMPSLDRYKFYNSHEATKKYISTATDLSGSIYADQGINHEDFHWPGNQHNPVIIPSNDNLLHFLLFNNVHTPNRSSIVEYVIDEKENTVKEIWEYGKDRPDIFASAWSGSTWLETTNNRMSIPANSLNPKTEVNIDKDIVFEFKISSNVDLKAYRAGRINLYPENKDEF